MPKNGKWGRWILLLVIFPVLFFLGLLFSIRNHYEVPRYFPKLDSATGKAQIIEGDTVYYSLTKWPFKSGQTLLFQDKNTLVILPDLDSEVKQSTLENVKPISSVLGRLPKNQLIIVEKSSENKSVRKVENEMFLEVNQMEWDSLVKVGLRLDEAHDLNPRPNAVFIDPDGIIRGMYNVGYTEDAERLKAEIKIIGSNLKNEK